MSGGSPAPPYCPMRRFASCSKGSFVCGLILRLLRRLVVVFFFGRLRLVAFFFAIKPPNLALNLIQRGPLLTTQLDQTPCFFQPLQKAGHCPGGTTSGKARLSP